MTIPDQKNTTSNPKGPKAGKDAEDPTAGKRQAAKPGTVKAKDVGSGDGAPAAATGGEIAAAESTLVGDAGTGRPAAKAKTATSSAAATPARGQTKAAEPAEGKKSNPVTEAPAEAVLRETPASAPTPQQNVTIRKAGFWPVAFGGVVAAGLGAAATIWALPYLPAGWLPDETPEAVAPQIDSDAIRADAVSAARAAAQEEVAALRSELADAAAAAPQENGDAGADTSETVAQSAAQIQALQEQLEQQSTRIEELAARPTIDAETAQNIQALAERAGALEQQIQSAAETAQTDIAAAQQEAQKLQEAAEDSTRRAEAVAAISALQAALDRGVTPDQARQTLQDAGIDTPVALTREVPSLDSLQAGFGDAARAALRASLREDSTTGGGNPLTNFLRAQTGARSVAPREGDDADAVLSRANAEVEAGRIGGALDQMQTLSDAARTAPAMAEWMAGANAYRDAQSALSDLSANSN